MTDSQDPEEHRKYVVGELDRLVGTDWPESLAARLGYENFHSLQAALKRWGRPDLAARFNRVNFDGLIPADRLTRQARKRGAAV